jgi:hypothetical protein
MPPRTKDAHLFELAKRGAEVRFRELVQDAKNLIDLFPHLRDSFDPDELPLPFIIRRGAGPVTGTGAAAPRRGKGMSAGARKAAGER